MNNEALVKWLRAMVSALPHGGKRRAADTLGISPSGLSKILGNPKRCFDEKTIRVVSWIQSSKSETYDDKLFPIVRVLKTEGLILETRKMKDGASFITWRLDTGDMPIIPPSKSSGQKQVRSAGTPVMPAPYATREIGAPEPASAIESLASL